MKLDYIRSPQTIANLRWQLGKLLMLINALTGQVVRLHLITCPLENFDATDVVALRDVRSYVASLPIGQDWAGTERAADRTCETCQRRSFQNC
jgi:hypothetical protein